ncbi:hypothetical protein FRC14_003960 [Serendipita sp. 396]|nr:hypothetical protein FRC14_003960 [Serendipita sp. 396]
MGLQESNVIEFGGRRDNDREYGIIQGKITLTASEVRTTFDGVIKQSADSCLKLLHGRKVKHLILVGGFGESPYLRLRFEEEFASQGTDVITDEEPSKKAAAYVSPTHIIFPHLSHSEGAVMWYIKQMVTAHVARFTIGASILVLFNPANAEHWKRRNGVIIYPEAN